MDAATESADFSQHQLGAPTLVGMHPKGCAPRHAEACAPPVSRSAITGSADFVNSRHSSTARLFFLPFTFVSTNVGAAGIGFSQFLGTQTGARQSDGKEIRRSRTIRWSILWMLCDALALDFPRPERKSTGNADSRYYALVGTIGQRGNRSLRRIIKNF